MGNTYYCEVIVEHGKFPAGTYMFKDDEQVLGWGTRAKLIQVANWVWKETDHGIFWVKNRSRPTPDLLTPDELKQFMWTKLKAEAI